MGTISRDFGILRGLGQVPQFRPAFSIPQPILFPRLPGCWVAFRFWIGPEHPQLFKCSISAAFRTLPYAVFSVTARLQTCFAYAPTAFPHFHHLCLEIFIPGFLFARLFRIPAFRQRFRPAAAHHSVFLTILFLVWISICMCA